MKFLFVILICTFISSVFGEKSYHVLVTKITWMNSHHTCRRMGGELVDIESLDELSRLSDYLKAEGYAANDRFWTAGNDYVSHGTYLSVSTGNRLPFTLWAAREPTGGNQHCVSLKLRNGVLQMYDWGCTQKAFGICQNTRSNCSMATYA